MSKSKTVFELEQKVIRLDRINKTFMVFVILLTLFVTAGIIYDEYKDSKVYKIPKNLAGTWYNINDQTAIIRFDLTSEVQQQLVKDIQRVCKDLNEQECMKSADIFNLKGGAQ